MQVPNFICLGTQKAGTTTLHDVLQQHPDIFLPQGKEAHYFDREERFVKGLKWWLDTYFSDYKNEKIMGVMTPEYLYDPTIPQRIYDQLGSKVKFLVVLRHPVERAYSHYLMTVRRGFEEHSFREAIALEPERIHLGKFENDYYSYLDRGNYSAQLERYFALFPKEQFLILSFEKEIKTGLEHTIQKILTFLDVPQLPLNTQIMSNVASEAHSETLRSLVRKDHFLKRVVKSILPPSLRRKLKKKIIHLNESKATQSSSLSREEKKELFETHFKHEPQKLMKLTGVDFSYWNSEH